MFNQSDLETQRLRDSKRSLNMRTCCHGDGVRRSEEVADRTWTADPHTQALTAVCITQVLHTLDVPQQEEHHLALLPH